MKQYILCGGIVALFHWTPLRSFLNSPSLLNFSLWIVLGLWIVAVAVTFPAVKKKWMQRKSVFFKNKKGKE